MTAGTATAVLTCTQTVFPDEVRQTGTAAPSVRVDHGTMKLICLSHENSIGAGLPSTVTEDPPSTCSTIPPGSVKLVNASGPMPLPKNVAKAPGLSGLGVNSDPCTRQEGDNAVGGIKS